MPFCHCKREGGDTDLCCGALCVCPAAGCRLVAPGLASLPKDPALQGSHCLASKKGIFSPVPDPVESAAAMAQPSPASEACPALAEGRQWVTGRASCDQVCMWRGAPGAGDFGHTQLTSLVSSTHDCWGDWDRASQSQNLRGGSGPLGCMLETCREEAPKVGHQRLQRALGEPLNLDEKR
jgi:hypothetical protein